MRVYLCRNVCVRGATAPSGLACIYLGLIPDLHHFSADSSIPPSLCPSGYLQVYRRLPFPACQHPILFLPCPLLSSLSSLFFHTVVICFISDCVAVLSLEEKPSQSHSSSSLPNRPNIAKLECICTSTLYSLSPLIFYLFTQYSVCICLAVVLVDTQM